MTRTTPHLRSVAEQLISFETTGADAEGTSALHVCEKLGVLLSKLLGSAGYWALLTRAVTLGQAEANELADVRVNQDGSLDGLDAVERRGAVVLVAHLLGLLTTFIGAALTIHLLLDVWPHAVIDHLDQGREA